MQTQKYKLRDNLPPLPERMKSLPVDKRGFPVPWFVQWLTDDGLPTDPGKGYPEFRIADALKRVRAVRERRCWVCGDTLGIYLAFVIGPMCALNRTTSEPPCHRECALFSVTACPFILMPKMVRREDNLPEVQRPAGLHLDRNPGAMLVWITRSYLTQRVEKEQDIEGGMLFRIGDPLELLWYAEGRQATRDEVLRSIEGGLPTLREAAELDGADAVEEMERNYKRVLETMVPK
jgi:hypothetical protein